MLITRPWNSFLLFYSATSSCTISQYLFADYKYDFEHHFIKWKGIQPASVYEFIALEKKNYFALNYLLKLAEFV